MKAIGYALIIAGLVWFLYVLSLGLLDARSGKESWDMALVHVFLVGLLPFLLACAVAAAALVYSQRRQADESTFQHEQVVLRMILKGSPLRFDEILRQVPINREQLRSLLIRLGEKQMFTGYVDWKGLRVVSGDNLDIVPGECPVCGNFTTSKSPLIAVCPRCDARIFLPRSDRAAVPKRPVPAKAEKPLEGPPEKPSPVFADDRPIGAFEIFEPPDEEESATSDSDESEEDSDERYGPYDR